MSDVALVTGADGFAGKILRDYLVGRGWAVRSCVLANPADSDLEIACDIRVREQIDRMFAWAGPVTHVFHLAAITFIPETILHPDTTFQVNVLGTLHMLEAARTHAPRARFINVGSAGAYGPPRSLPVTEEHPLNPEDPYSISKATADLYCGFAHQVQGMDVTRLRPFNHAGPGQSDRFVLPAFARQVAQIEAGVLPPVLRVGDLNTARDFLHVADVVRAYEVVARKGVAGAVYNICSGKSRRIQDVVDILLGLSDAKIQVEVEPARLRPVDVADIYGSHDKLTADTGWTPQIPLERLLGELLDYYRSSIAAQ